MRNKRFIYGYVFILLLILAVILYRDQWLKQINLKSNNIERMPTSFNECVASGLPVQESYPRRCLLPSGQSFSEDIGNELEKIDLIVVDSPRPNSNVNKLLTVSGKARGTWFFEASFPISLIDIHNNKIATGVAQAQGDWMTEDFVSFVATISIPESASGQAKLILKKDNPSGDQARADELIVPVNIVN